MDTPGFDDTHRTDGEVLELITRFLTIQYQLGIPLKGIIYLHRITDIRMQGSAFKNFQMFQKLCGEEALGNVVLLTTMWDKLKDEGEGLEREQNLRESFWHMMVEKNSYIAKFDGTKEMAEAVVTMLLGKQPVVLDIQRELHDQRKTLSQTAAGKDIMPTLQADLDESNEQIRQLEEQIRHAREQKAKADEAMFQREREEAAERRKRARRQRAAMLTNVAAETESTIQTAKKRSKWKDGISLFAQVTGIAIGIVANLLPLLGISS